MRSILWQLDLALLIPCSALLAQAPAQLPTVALGVAPVSTQKCSEHDKPRNLPSVAQLVDSVLLSTLISGDAAIPKGESLFSAGFDSAGSPVRFLALESSLPDSVLARLQRSVASLLEPQPAAQPWRVRLRIETGNARRFRVERSEDCVALIYDDMIVHQELARGLSELGGSAGHPGHSTVAVSIGPTGVVTDVKVIQSTLTPKFDSAAVYGARASRYHPALADRTPVASADTLMLVVFDRRHPIFFGDPREGRRLEMRGY